MGRKLNLEHLSAAECEHILEVVHKDFNIRFQEKERIRGIEADVEAEETKYCVLSRSRDFNDRYCICCYSRFFPLINPRVLCGSCRFQVCKSCSEVDQERNERSCNACLKQRDLQKKSNDWFYSSVKKRFRRCGSAKVIRSLYKRRLTDDDVTRDNRMLVSRSDSESVTRNWRDFNEDNEDALASSSQRRMQNQSRPVDWLIDDAAMSRSLAVEGEGQSAEPTLHLQLHSEPIMEGPRTDGTENEGEEEEDHGTHQFQTHGERLSMDSCIQTEREGVAEAGTMTVVSEASRFFHCFDGMATVSTEGLELDPKFVTRPHNIRVLEGEPLHVECKVNGTEPLDVLWFCNRNQVQQLDEDDRCEIRRHGNAFALTIYDMRHDDTGEFLCIAVNAIGQCAQGFTVTVDDNAHAQLPPTFNNQMDNIEIVPEGSDAVLRCSVAAYPEPKVTWFRNNKPVIQGGRHRIEKLIPGPFQCSLVIESVRGDDSGCYVAIAKNAAGQSSLPIQLLIQPNPIVSKDSAAASGASWHLLSSSKTPDGEDSAMYIDTSEAELMRLAQDLSRTQGRFTTTATRMLRSADAMSSMQSQLDEMDRALEGLEVKVLDVLSDGEDDDDDDDSDDEDSLNNNNNRFSWRRLANEVDDMKSSAEAVGMVTSAALQLLSSAKEIAMETLSESDYSSRIQKGERDRGERGGGGGGEKEEEEVEAEEEEEEDKEFVYADDLDLSYQELENLYKVRLISRSELKRRLIQRRNIRDICSYLRRSASNAASGDQSEDSAMETSVDSLETGPEVNTRYTRNRKGRETRSVAVSVSCSSSSGDGNRRSTEADGKDESNKKEGEVLKEAEQQIYLTSGKVFSLEDCIRELERKVLEVDETTPAETLASLENSVARAVAQVTQSDNEVNEIEKQVERWMERSGRAARRCNDRFRQEQQEQQVLQLSMTSSATDNRPTESVVIATAPDAENNTTASIIG